MPDWMNSKITIVLASVACLLISVACLRAQVPQLINYQGRVVVGGTNFNGTGQFGFALVNTNGSTTYWSNDGTSAAGSQPATAVSLPVSGGLYSLALGPAFTYQLLSFASFTHGLNYGYDKVRFPSPLPSGARIRMKLTVQSAERVPGGIQLRSLQVVEAEGIAKPIVVAESLARIVE